MSGNGAEFNSNEFQLGYDSAGGGASHDSSYGYNNQASGGSLQAQSGGSAKTSFFANPSQSRYEDLKQMLESSKELLKLEAMKRIITMVAKGRSAESARELFPHVVKNVVTKNTELKKLVYLYLTRYAEQEQDLALLSIATFQHALKDPNPLIRGSAIRVLSSIRVPMISPIMLIAIKDCANDMSPYVRKTAAHAIPKLVSLDPEIKEEVIDIIGKLLADKVSLVLGSAVAAFEEVCPERFDLIHANYRKLCSLLVDVDEWGQIIIINMLIRYARTQFIDPNQHGSNMAKVDQDHLLLVRSVKPLLQSRNSGVVLAVIQLYLSVAPHFELSAQLIRPLIRLLHSHHEIQLIILKNIVTLTSHEFNQQYLGKIDEAGIVNGNNGNSVTQKTVKACNEEDSTDDESEDDAPMLITSRKTIKSLFEPYLKSFFVKANDSTQIKILKLEILTNLSNSGNISLILREFQAYIQNYQDDLEFMSATIESIGQCASMINEIAPMCLNGLVSLLSNRNESIVAQSIVVIRTQIINKDQSIISHIIRQIVKLMEKISMPQARATIAWIVAEFCARNEYASKVAPDVLRVIAKSFTNENDLVKLQALNLAAKLYLTKLENESTDETSQERLKMLINYIFNLAKYDLNYDVRDRGRFLRQLINDREMAKKILLVPKLVPNVSQRAERFVYQDASQPTTNALVTKLANSVDSARFRIGTLSHFLGKKTSEYEELPDWPQVQPDPTVRRVKTPEPISQPKVHIAVGKVDVPPKNGFLGLDSSEEEDEEDEEEEVGEEDEDEVEDEEVDEEEEDEEVGEVSEDEEEEEEDDDDEDDEEEDESEEERVVEVKNTNNKKESRRTKESVPAVDLLLDLGDLTLNDSNSMSSSTSSALHYQPLLPMTGSSSTTSPTEPYRILESPELVTYREFSLIEVPYQFRASYRFPRINEENRTLVELVLKNELPCETEESTNNRIMIQAPSNGTVIFKNVEAQDNMATISLQPNETRLVTLSVDFNESASLGIELQFNRSQTVKLVAPLGDILYPVRFSTLESFQVQRAKLTGMNEVITTCDLSIKPTAVQLNQILLTLANLCTNAHLTQTEPNTILYYSACTLKFKSLILVTLEIKEEEEKVSLKSTINCEKMVLGSMLSKFIKDECTKQLH